MKPSIITLFSLGILRLSCAVQHLSTNCIIVAISDARINILDESYEETVFKCDGDGFSYRLELPTTEKDHMQQLLNGGNLVINESILLNTDVIVEGDAIISLGVQPWSFGSNKSQKSLRSKQGNKPILAVRVTDVGGLANPDDAATIGDNIFGTLGDQVNLKSQMFACSFGQLKITNEYSVNIKEHLAAPGVIEVDIGISLTTNNRFKIHDAITAAIEKKLGFSLPGPFDQVMYVIEKCYVGDCGWGAYAFVNGWMSVYQAEYYSIVGIQMHEIGHNFGFAHSGGLDGESYSDHTCQMGNPLNDDDIGKMCYNPAKNWAIGWYDSKKSEVDISKSDVNHIETIVGVADFDNNPDERNVIIKLETGTDNDYFVGFNRATGANLENDEADDEVTIIQTGANGESYSQSYLRATLKQGEYWALNGMEITAEIINVDSTPGTATVSIKKGSRSPPTAPLAPTGSCFEDGEKQFLMNEKVKNNGELKIVSRKCSWLSRWPQAKMEKLCKKKMRCHETLGSAEAMCPESCRTSCDPCHQSDEALFYFKTIGQKVIVKSCDWLSNRGDIGKQCQETERSGCYAPASEVCPRTCSMFDCGLQL